MPLVDNFYTIDTIYMNKYSYVVVINKNEA
jgi:hypothetical protein